MKLIIAGSRSITDHEAVFRFINEYRSEIKQPIHEVISGCAKGVDKIGEAWAIANRVLLTKFPANWLEHGKGAGPIRNKKMGDYADAALIIWDGESKGAKHMGQYMISLGKPVKWVLGWKGMQASHLPKTGAATPERSGL